MNQAGLKPKSHKSGIYWTRTQAGQNKKKKEKPQEPKKFHCFDLNKDGHVDVWEVVVTLAGALIFDAIIIWCVIRFFVEISLK
jgi:hypothetical protein